jgi:hypothetical protein
VPLLGVHVPAVTTSPAVLKHLGVHRDVRGTPGSREGTQEIVGVAVRDSAIACSVDEVIPRHDLSFTGTRVGEGSAW